MPANDPGADRLLVSQCQAGNPAAWEQLHARLRERGHDVLPKRLKQDALKMDELIQDTLTGLFREKGALAAAYRAADSLDEFLNFLLHRAAKHYYREWDRRRRREVLLPDSELAKLPAAEALPGIEPDLVERLLQSLTPAERRYFEWARLPKQEAPPCPFRNVYARVLKHRIKKKLRRLLSGD